MFPYDSHTGQGFSDLNGFLTPASLKTQRRQDSHGMASTPRPSFLGVFATNELSTRSLRTSHGSEGRVPSPGACIEDGQFIAAKHPFRRGSVLRVSFAPFSAAWRRLSRSQGDEDIAAPKAISLRASGPDQWLNPRSDSGKGCPLVSGANGSAISPITYTAHIVTPAYRKGSGMSLYTTPDNTPSAAGPAAATNRPTL